jgi:hypothetical protein
VVRHLASDLNEKKKKFRGWGKDDALSTEFDEKLENETRRTNVAGYYLRKYKSEMLPSP